MKINKIKKMKNGKYKLELDNKESIITYDEVILNNNLLFNKEIDSDIFNKLNNENDYYNIYSKVIKYITTKMRSKLEIIKYIEKLGVSSKDKMIDDLMNINLINDEMFLRAFINDKINLTNDGLFKIKKELLSHDIDEKLIDEELAKYDENIFRNKLNKIAVKKIKSNIKSSKYILKQKLFNDFLNLGYSRELINEVLSQININDDKQIEREYNSLYKKLSKKYKGNELDFQIKNKLYSKGFNQESINELKKMDSY